jgi:TonB family protein
VIPFLFALASGLLAQTSGAVQQVFKEAEYPETLKMAQLQGDVLVIARIDRQGRLRNLYPLSASDERFVEPALAAVAAWRFKPAMKDGSPIDIAANIGVRFRLQLTGRHGKLPKPMLGDLSVSPADASGKPTAPEGFPVRRGMDPRIAVEALLDVSLNPTAHMVPLNVEAWSPSLRRSTVYADSVLVPANATELKVSFSAAVPADWEDGVYILRFFISDEDAGGGQFWLAKDPSKFDFAAKMPKPKPGRPS